MRDTLTRLYGIAIHSWFLATVYGPAVYTVAALVLHLAPDLWNVGLIGVSNMVVYALIGDISRGKDKEIAQLNAQVERLKVKLMRSASPQELAEMFAEASRRAQSEMTASDSASELS